MAAWVVKMMLKVFKPFIKMAIFSAIFEALAGMLNQDPEEGEEEPVPEGE